MNPKEFAERMKNLKEHPSRDKELIHSAMDDLMCDLLKNMGYEEGVRIFVETEK